MASAVGNKRQPRDRVGWYFYVSNASFFGDFGTDRYNCWDLAQADVIPFKAFELLGAEAAKKPKRHSTQETKLRMLPGSVDKPGCFSCRQDTWLSYIARTATQFLPVNISQVVKGRESYVVFLGSEFKYLPDNTQVVLVRATAEFHSIQPFLDFLPGHLGCNPTRKSTGEFLTAMAKIPVTSLA